MKYAISALTFCSLSLFSSCQQPANQVKEINENLQQGKITASQVLSDPSLMSLHSLTEFREAIKKNAKAEIITMVTPNEPGTKITVRGRITDKAGIAKADQLVYVYQTSSEGWYSDTAPHILKNEGDRRHARLFGYFRTGKNGEFEFVTVMIRDIPNHPYRRISILN